MNNQELIRQQVLEQARASIDNIYDGLVTHKYRPRYPEEMFQKHFLPAFTGSVAFDLQVMNDWISIAGSVTNEVDIIDNNGIVLFVVPSLLNTNVIDITNRSNSRSLDTIYGQFEMRNNNIPIAAASYLNNELNKKADAIIDTSSDQTNSWNSILDRYGISNNQSPRLSSDMSDRDDDVVYD